MDSPTAGPSATAQRPGKRAKRSGGSVEPGQKPKKVNSEIRKQQNRIASRNYREKRKRKLQYLQQLLHDQDSGEEQQQPRTIMESVEDIRARSMSAEYNVQSSPMNSTGYSPNMGYSAMASTSGNIIDPVPRTTATYSNHLLATTRAFSNIQPSWSPPMYHSPPQMNTLTWGAPQWMPPVDFSQQLPSSRPSHFSFTQPRPQQVYNHASSPLPQPQETVASTDYFLVGQYHPYRRAATHSPGIPNRMTAQRPFVSSRSVYI